MDDELCACHEVEIAEATAEESDSPPPPVTAILNNRPTERYVPRAVTCENCGASAESFDWFQRIPEGDVAEGTPPRELYFCDIVCVSWYSSEHFEGYDSDLLPHSVRY